ncbi:MAG: hypothetical protein RL097_287 [Candidatus Parcubacteria bacterium]|jgi:hypothetical protein
MKNSNYYKIRLVLVFYSILLLVPFLLHADTTVTNTVSVSANSSTRKEQQQATVHTVINGKVVEDWSTTSSTSIIYTKIHTTDTSSTISTTTEQTALLHELLTRLQALISLYVTLVTQ